MSKVTFTDLYIQNFSIIQDIHVPLNTPGITIIDGPIGTGKSSILEAFYFCLTGEFFEKANTLKSVINRFNKDPMTLIIKGYTDITFKIIRTMTFKSHKSSDVKHTLQFYIGDTAVHDTVSSIVQIQERIMAYLDIDSLLLFNSKIFGQGDISSFTKVNDRKKKIIIDKLVGAGVCDKAHKVAVTLLTETTNKCTEYSLTTDNLNKRIHELIIEINDLKSKQKEWAATKQEATTVDQQQIIVDEITQYTTIINELVLTKTQFNTLVKDVSEEEDKIRKLKLYLPQITATLTEYNTQRIHIDRKKNYTIGQLAIITKDISRLNAFAESGETTKCPTCYSFIDFTAITQALIELSKKAQEYKTLITEQKILIEAIEQKHTNLSSKKSEVDRLITQYSNEILSNQQIINKIDSINTQIKKYEQLIESKNELLHLLQNTQENQTNTVCPYTELITAKETELKAKTEWYTSLMSEYKTVEHYKKYVGFFAKAFNNNGIPQLISNDALKVLNVLMDSYKNKLLGSNFKLKFKTKMTRENEEIYPDVLNPTGGDGYFRQSKGERRKIDLCQMFALSDFAKMQGKCDINIMFFDEVFSELNHAESDRVLDVIKDYPVESKFIISHKDLFKDEYNNIIKMQKNDTRATTVVHVVGKAEEPNDKSVT